MNKLTCQDGMHEHYQAVLPFSQLQWLHWTNYGGSIGAIILLSYHLGLDVKEFCDLDMNKRETFAVKTLAPNLTAMIPTVSVSFTVIPGAFDSSSITFTSTITMCYSDPILSSEGHSNRRMRNAQSEQNCQISWQTFMLPLDWQNGKMPFCPIGFVLINDHISEVKYETKIKASDCKKSTFFVLYSQGVTCANQKALQNGAY